MMIIWSSLALGAPTVGAIVNPTAVVDTAADREGEDPFATHTWVRGFARDETKRGDRWFVEAWLQHHVLIGAEPRTVDNNEAFYELSLGPTGVDVRLGGPDSPARLRAGALVTSTGKLELLPVNDVVNPVDARMGLLTPREYQRVPVPMAILKLSKGHLRSETTYVPFATPDRLWLRDTDWSLIRQRMVDDYLEDLQSTENLEQGNFPDSFSAAQWREFVLTLRSNQQRESKNTSYRRYSDVATNFNDLPQAFVGDIVQQLTWSGSGFDVGVVGGYLRSRFPRAVLREDLRGALQDRQELFDLIDEGLFGTAQQRLERADSISGSTIAFSWPYTWLAGAQGSTVVGDVALRGEVGFLSDRVVRQRWGRARTVPQLAGGVGVDVTRGSQFGLSLEGRVQRLFVDDAVGDTLVFARPLQVQIAGGVRGTFAAERFTWQIAGAVDATFAEAFVKPTVAWRVSQPFEIELGALIIDGFRTDAPQTIEDALTYEGGPLSYWQQNDGVTLGVRWIL